ncbi:hypothetical protein JL722_1008 [Aureococcus anophagefferens]|nr:hypothetical protein JL722_1008 [Aureococcus anophagefferens]
MDALEQQEAALERHEAALERHEAAQARGDEIEQSLEDAETARDAEAKDRESTEEAKEKVDPRWLEVEAGARFTRETAMQEYPQLSKRSFEDLPAEKVRRPKIGKAHACDVKTYSVSDIEKLVARQAAPDQKPRYPQLKKNSFKDLPVEKARPLKPRAKINTYLAAHVDAIAEGRAWDDAAAAATRAGAGGGDEGGDVAGAGGGDAGGDDGDGAAADDDGAGATTGDGGAARRRRALATTAPRRIAPSDLDSWLVDNLKSRELVRRWQDASATAAARAAAANALEDADWKEQQDPGRTCYCVSTFDSHHYDSNKDDAAADVARGVMAALHFALDEKRPCDADVRRDLCLQALACEARAQELLRSDKALRVVRVLEAAILKGDRDRAAARRIVAATLFTRHHAEIKCLIHIKFDNLDAVDIAYEASGRAERGVIDTPDRHDIDAEIELAEIDVV